MAQSPSRLSKIKERDAEATAGPWRWFGNRETDQIWLATPDRGRLIIMTPDTYVSEHVFNHNHVEGYTLAEARERWVKDPESMPHKHYNSMTLEELQSIAKARGLTIQNHEAPDEPLVEYNFISALSEHDEQWTAHLPGWEHQWWAWRDHRESEADEEGWVSKRTAQRQLNEFLKRGHHPEERGDHDLDAGPKDAWLTRSSRVTSELRFGVDGILKSYRDMARFQVLNGMTEAEAKEANFQGRLYREDIVGLAHPDADFIANAREDIPYLLRHIAELEGIIRRLGVDPGPVNLDGSEETEVEG